MLQQKYYYIAILNCNNCTVTCTTVSAKKHLRIIKNARLTLKVSTNCNVSVFKKASKSKLANIQIYSCNAHNTLFEQLEQITTCNCVNKILFK